MRKGLIYIICLLTLFFACKKEFEPNNPIDNLIISETIVLDSYSNYAKVKAEITTNEFSSIDDYGHCWSKNNNPTIDNEFSSNSELLASSHVFETEINGLEVNQTYYIRAYAKSGNTYIYGDETDFFTLRNDNEPLVITDSSGSISSSFAVIYGSILDTGDAPVTQHGHCWSTTSNPTISNDNTQLGSASTGSFNSSLTNLSANTTYYYKAYATNSFGTVYGDELTFTTTNGLASISTTGSNNVSCTEASLLGDITSIGDAPVTQHGHCWSTTSNPTISNDNTQLGSASTGSFNSSLTNLSANTTYYYKAYATNSFGTVYGAQFIFNTSGGPVADFSSVNTVIEEGDLVNFNDLSQNNPTSWSWISSGANPSTSTQQNPSLQYNTMGYYNVELIATNACGSDNEIKNNYIKVIECEDFQNGSANTSWDSNIGWNNSSSGYTGNGLFAMGGAAGDHIGRTFFNIPANTSISFWYKDATSSQVGDFKLINNNTGQILWQFNPFSGSTNWVNVTINIPSGNFYLYFETNRMMYLDDICIEPN